MGLSGNTGNSDVEHLHFSIGNNGLTKDDLYKISDDLGLNTATLKTCMDDKNEEDEVKKDLADANAAGATGTPTFFIGKSTGNGIIEGTKIVGAQPFSAFKQAIDAIK